MLIALPSITKPPRVPEAIRQVLVDMHQVRSWNPQIGRELEAV